MRFPKISLPGIRMLAGQTPGPSTNVNPTLGQQIASLLPLKIRETRPEEAGQRPQACVPSSPFLSLPVTMWGEIAKRLDRSTWEALRQVCADAKAAAPVKALEVRTRNDLISALTLKVFVDGAITKLIAKNCRLVIAEVQNLAKNTSLISLDLASNNIGDEGAQALAANTSITSLDLAANGIGDAGAQALAANTRITALNLQNNNIGDAGAQALAANTRITKLDLANCRIGPAGRAALEAVRDRFEVLVL
jgi:hypothetical protein